MCVCVCVCVCVVLTYPEVFAGDGQEEEGKRDHNAEDDNDGEDKEYHMGCRKAGLTTEAAYLHRGRWDGGRDGWVHRGRGPGGVG